MKFSTILVLITLFFSAFTAFAARNATQPLPPLGCSWTQANQIVENDIKVSAAQIPSAVSFATTVQISGTPDSQGNTSEVNFSYAILDKAGKIVGLGMETLNGECQDQGGSFTGASSGNLPVQPL